MALQIDATWCSCTVGDFIVNQTHAWYASAPVHTRQGHWQWPCQLQLRLWLVSWAVAVPVLVAVMRTHGLGVHHGRMHGTHQILYRRAGARAGAVALAVAIVVVLVFVMAAVVV